MKAVVVDASVIAAALFPEPYNTEANALLVSGSSLHAPDLVYAELGNVIWKRRSRGEISEEYAADLLSDVMRLPLEITPSRPLVCDALELAMRTGRTAYECLYLALAVRTKTVMVSNDRRFVNALAGGPFKEQIVWLGAVG
jgi:predicted nucleic acid-binding protein